MRTDINFKRGQIRGYLFEVVVRILLRKNGWELLSKQETGRIEIEDGKIIIRGRGTWHQIDSACLFKRRVPFTFPLRLLVEAKYYAKEIQKDKIRSFIGVIKDISENYFINEESNHIRYTDLGAFFSATGFHSEAINLALAHGIQPISYQTNPLMVGVKEAIVNLEENCLQWSRTVGNKNLHGFMTAMEEVLQNDSEGALNEFISKYCRNRDISRSFIIELKQSIIEVKTNFFGLTSTGVLLHFLGTEEFPENLFEKSDEQRCKIHIKRKESTVEKNGSDSEILMSLQFSEDVKKREFFFDVPPGLETVIENSRDVLSEKEAIFESISILIKIGNILRALNIEIDKNWLKELKNRSKG